MRQTQLFFILILCKSIFAQSATEHIKKDLGYYLPKITYDPTITSPRQFLGFDIGEYHVSHDQVYHYMKQLDRESDKVEIHEYARSHEQRPLIVLYISSKENIKNKESIKKRHEALTEDSNTSTDNLPLVLYQGYSIHGNESSGINAAMLVAYYLIAGQSEEINQLLDKTLILFDPCYNPDGVQRFSTWANSHRGRQLISDPASREYNEVWPGGRFNHYWFDLNRDWLLLTHPESRGRVSLFQQWKPNILTDHHEMGSNGTFFFQPGVPSRVNPNIPQQNQDLTTEIATYHAKALDAIGSLYYDKEGFDDYYFGKGSTYPDIHGGIGILFEQASSRGHYQETSNGILTFPFTIRNQVATSISTQKAALAMHDKLLQYKRDFYQNLKKEINQNATKGYLFFDADVAKINELVHILLLHKIELFGLDQDLNVANKKYKKGQTYFVSLNQKQYKLIKTCFEEVTQFNDSLFYDVSAWTLPHAFDIDFSACNSQDATSIMAKSSKLQSPPTMAPEQILDDKAYAYHIPWSQAYAPAVLNFLLDKSIVVKTSTPSFQILNHAIASGDLIIPSYSQNNDEGSVLQSLKEAQNKYNITILPLAIGSGTDVSLGHPGIHALKAIRPFTIVGQGISALDAGELWHYMDHRLQRTMSMIDKKDLTRANLKKYNTLILVEGNYNDLSETFVKNLETWIKEGNQVIAMSNAIDFLKNKNIIKIEQQEQAKKSTQGQGAYMQNASTRGAEVVGGCIVKSEADLTHPLCFGLSDNKLPLFKQSSTIYKMPTQLSASPLKYDLKNTLLSGYLPKGFPSQLAGTPAVTIHINGGGSIVCFPDNVLFRGYWWGGFKVFANALFFQHLISKETMIGL